MIHYISLLDEHTTSMKTLCGKSTWGVCNSANFIEIVTCPECRAEYFKKPHQDFNIVKKTYHENINEADEDIKEGRVHVSKTADEVIKYLKK